MTWTRLLPMALLAALPTGAVSLAQPAATPHQPAPRQASQGFLDARISELAAKHPTIIRAGMIGASRGARAIHVLRLAGPGAEEEADKRPALLIVAGINGQHLVGTDTAIGLAEKLASEHAALLNDRTVFIIPCLNPDTAELHRARSGPGGGAYRDFSRSQSPDDADRDGRFDEDGPVDLNGDGVITMMRVPEPLPATGLEATVLIDPDEPRLMRAPEKDKAERATHALIVEGRDQDGDGKIAEDGPGGVEFDMNFPYRWPEFNDGAGPHQLAEPETLALVQFMRAHDNILAVLTFGPHDTLIAVPPAGKFDETGSVPIGIENDDKPVYEKASEHFKELTRITSSPSAPLEGSFVGWAYAHFGVYSFSTPVWVRPDLVKEKDSEEARSPAGEGAQEPRPEAPQPDKPSGPATIQIGSMTVTLTQEGVQAAMAEVEAMNEADRAKAMEAFRALPAAVQQRIMAIGQGMPDPDAPDAAHVGGEAPKSPPAKKDDKKKSEDARWLEYSDTQRNGEGFIAWQPFDHPQLGKVEIGGFTPGFRMNPPDAELERLITEQTSFAAWLLEKFPRLVVEAPVAAEKLSPGVWRITARVRNEGDWPTRSAIGAKARRLAYTMLEVELPENAVLSGDRIRRLSPLAGGAGVSQEWIVAPPPGSASVRVRVRSPELGVQSLEIALP